MRVACCPSAASTLLADVCDPCMCVLEQAAGGGGDVSSAVVGSLCVLAPDFASYSDASGGPLTPGQVGVVVQVATGRLQLRPQSGGDRVWWYVCVLQACWLLCVHVVAVGRRTWRRCASGNPCVCRYDRPALRMAGGSSRRPTTGDRVVLTADFASHRDAADGATSPRPFCSTHFERSLSRKEVRLAHPSTVMGPLCPHPP